MTIDYDIPDLVPYINWDYFFHAWGMTGKPEGDRKALRRDADSMLASLAGHCRAHALFALFAAHSDGDDVVLAGFAGENAAPAGSKTVLAGFAGEAPAPAGLTVGEFRIPFLRQQQQGSDFLCLSDFIRPDGDVLGVFATAADAALETDFSNDPYRKMMAQLLADRLAEAAAERMHEAVRRHYWGYAPDEQLTMQQLHAERFCGIRPAVGYPSLPDTSVNFLIDRLIGMKQIGIRLTENGAMRPHASVSGFMFAHPAAHYFSVGTIGEDQLADYARRRGVPVATLRPFLSANLKN